MVDEDRSILNKARQRLVIAEEFSHAYTEAVETSFQQEVIPELERIKGNLIKEGVPKIFSPLADELQKLISERENCNMVRSEKVCFYYTPPKDSNTREEEILIDTHELIRKDNPYIANINNNIHRKFIDLWEKGLLASRITGKWSILIENSVMQFGFNFKNSAQIIFEHSENKSFISCSFHDKHANVGYCSDTFNFPNPELNKFLENITIEIDRLFPPILGN